MNGNPASGEICARAFDALLQVIMRSGHLLSKKLGRKGRRKSCLIASINFLIR